jgi:hypothetical protein
MKDKTPAIIPKTIGTKVFSNSALYSSIAPPHLNEGLADNSIGNGKGLNGLPSQSFLILSANSSKLILTFFGFFSVDSALTVTV